MVQDFWLLNFQVFWFPIGRVYSRSILVVRVDCKGFWWYVACFYSPYRTVNKGEPASVRNVQDIIMIGRVNTYFCPHTAFHHGSPVFSVQDWYWRYQVWCQLLWLISKIEIRNKKKKHFSKFCVYWMDISQHNCNVVNQPLPETFRTSYWLPWQEKKLHHSYFVCFNSLQYIYESLWILLFFLSSNIQKYSTYHTCPPSPNF
jgi:hypothetical protein